jgi:regulator of protease activity HflC (stomatin/prohibitin superfamily)
MESAFAWIGQLIEWFGQFIPRFLVVDMTEAVVKLRLGNEITELKPGKVHFYWPFISIIKRCTIVRDTLDLTAQTFETKDGITVQASGMVSYIVTDAISLLTTVTDPGNTIRDLVMTCIQEVLIQYTWVELREGLVSGQLRKELVREAQRTLKTYGIKVLNVGLKDLARTRVFKLAIEQSTDGTF